MEAIKVSYGRNDDILFIRRTNEKPRGSVEIGDFIIDFSQDMQKAVGLEVLNASNVLSKQLGVRISKEALSNIHKAMLRTEHRGDAIYVIYGIMLAENRMEQSMIPILQAV
jgi:hypothetical protein